MLLPCFYRVSIVFRSQPAGGEHAGADKAGRPPAVPPGRRSGVLLGVLLEVLLGVLLGVLLEVLLGVLQGVLQARAEVWPCRWMGLGFRV